MMADCDNPELLDDKDDTYGSVPPGPLLEHLAAHVASNYLAKSATELKREIIDDSSHVSDSSPQLAVTTTFPADKTVKIIGDDNSHEATKVPQPTLSWADVPDILNARQEQDAFQAGENNHGATILLVSDDIQQLEPEFLSSHAELSSSAESDWFVDEKCDNDDAEEDAHQSNSMQPLTQDAALTRSQSEPGRAHLVLDKANLVKLESELSPAAKDRDNDSVATNYSSRDGDDEHDAHDSNSDDDDAHSSHAGTVIFSTPAFVSSTTRRIHTHARTSPDNHQGHGGVLRQRHANANISIENSHVDSSSESKSRLKESYCQRQQQKPPNRKNSSTFNSDGENQWDQANAQNAIFEEQEEEEECDEKVTPTALCEVTDLDRITIEERRTINEVPRCSSDVNDNSEEENHSPFQNSARHTSNNALCLVQQPAVVRGISHDTNEASDAETEILSCYEQDHRYVDRHRHPAMTNTTTAVDDSVVGGACSTVLSSSSASAAASFVSIPLSNNNHRAFNIIDYTEITLRHQQQQEKDKKGKHQSQGNTTSSGSFFRRTNPSPNKEAHGGVTSVSATGDKDKASTPQHTATPKGAKTSHTPSSATFSMPRTGNNRQMNQETDHIHTVTKYQRDALFQSLSWDAPSTYASSSSPFHFHGVGNTGTMHLPSPIRQQALFSHQPTPKMSASLKRSKSGDHREFGGENEERRGHDSASKIGFFPVPNSIHKSRARVTLPHRNAHDVWAPQQQTRRPSKDSSIMEETEFALLEPSPSTLALESSQRVTATAEIGSSSTTKEQDIEREDALDFLTCLVERSKAFEREQMMSRDEQGETNTPTSFGNDNLNPFTVQDHHVGGIERTFSLSLADIAQTTDALSRASFLLAQEENAPHDHVHRCRILQELVSSYNYATEMKRATTSASMWLDSIGRGQQGLSALALSQGTTSTATLNRGFGSSGAKIKCIPNGFERTGEEMHTSDDDADDSPFMMDPSEVGTSTFTKVATSDHDEEAPGKTLGDKNAAAHVSRTFGLKDVLDQLNATESRLTERDEVVARLNEDLTRCRTEIGRLQQEARMEVSRGIVAEYK
jgi:hypothetical protein